MFFFAKSIKPEDLKHNETEFDKISNEATTLLNKLKTMDESLQFVEQFNSTDYTALAGQLQYGSFELKQFTDSKGRTMEYYIYVPDYGTDVSNLPVMLYMHGGSSYNTSRKSFEISNLTRLIKNKEITPAGIVIMPYVRDFEGGASEETIKELTDSVVQEYNADSNRISVSGHSYGGVMTYRMVKKYPNYFSAALPISGNSDVTEALSNVKVWAFYGKKEGNGAKRSQENVNAINNMGGSAMLTLLNENHEGMNLHTYQGTYESPNGEVMSPLDWAFQQTRTT